MVSPHTPSCAFLLPSTCELERKTSAPAVQLPGAPVGSPAVPITPAQDSPPTFCFTRTTAISVAGTSPRAAPVCAARTPKFVLQRRPLSLVLTRSGTVIPPIRPVRGLQD